MDVTNDDYIRLLSALLPPGPAWSASDPAIAGAAPSLTRVHQRADALMRELDPQHRPCTLVCAACRMNVFPQGHRPFASVSNDWMRRLTWRAASMRIFTLHSLLPWADQTPPSLDTTKARSPAHRPVLTR